MYDKVKLRIDRTDIASDYGAIPVYLEDVNTDQWGHQHGHIGSMNVVVYENGISLLGSLSKYYYGNNVFPLTRSDTTEALNKIGDVLHVDMNLARVNTFEFGTVLTLIHEIPDYLPLFGDLPRFTRLLTARETLRYTQKCKEYLFYDKILQMKKCKEAIPPGFDNMHLMKYEMQFNSRVAMQFGMKEIRASALTDRQFYRRLLTMWKDEYFKINKKKQMKTEYMNQIHKPKDAYKAFMARLMALNQIDNETQIETFISELKASGAFNNKVYYTRLKKDLHDTMKMAGVTETNEMIHELDNEIKNAAAYT